MGAGGRVSRLWSRRGGIWPGFDQIFLVWLFDKGRVAAPWSPSVSFHCHRVDAGRFFWVFPLFAWAPKFLGVHLQRMFQIRVPELGYLPSTGLGQVRIPRWGAPSFRHFHAWSRWAGFPSCVISWSWRFLAFWKLPNSVSVSSISPRLPNNPFLPRPTRLRCLLLAYSSIKLIGLCIYIISPRNLGVQLGKSAWDFRSGFWILRRPAFCLEFDTPDPKLPTPIECCDKVMFSAWKAATFQRQEVDSFYLGCRLILQPSCIAARRSCAAHPNFRLNAWRELFQEKCGRGYPLACCGCWKAARQAVSLFGADGA